MESTSSNLISRIKIQDSQSKTINSITNSVFSDENVATESCVHTSTESVDKGSVDSNEATCTEPNDDESNYSYHDSDKDSRAVLRDASLKSQSSEDSSSLSPDMLTSIKGLHSNVEKHSSPNIVEDRISSVTNKYDQDKKSQESSMETNQQMLFNTSRKSLLSLSKSFAELHIMISYHHDSSFDVCDKIRTGLMNQSYKVWMDKYDLYEGIYQDIAVAIENSWLVLLCFNSHYALSDYCRREALYTVNKRIAFIPCLMEKDYDATGWLGILITDELYVEFFQPPEFQDNFNELMRKVTYFERKPRKRSSIQDQSTVKPSISISTVTNSGNERFSRFDVSVAEYKRSIGKNDQPLEMLSHAELIQLINYLRECLSNDNPSSPMTDHNYLLQSDHGTMDMIQQLITGSRHQLELLQKLFNIFPKR